MADFLRDQEWFGKAAESHKSHTQWQCTSQHRHPSPRYEKQPPQAQVSVHVCALQVSGVSFKSLE